MNQINAWLQGIGLEAIPEIHRVHLMVAGGLILLALLLGVLAQRFAGPALSNLWKRGIGQHGEGIGARVPAIVRHGTTALLLAIVLNVTAWPPIAALMLGFTLGAATALAAVQLLRGLGIPRALRLAQALHAGTWLLLAAFGWCAGLGPAYWLGLAAILGLLVYEHRVARSRDVAAINAAFFQSNAWIGLVFVLSTFLDRLA